MMDEATRQRLEAVGEMFGTLGWRYLREDLETQRATLKEGALSNVHDEKSLYFHKGVLRTLDQILGLEAVVDVTLNPPGEGDL